MPPSFQTSGVELMGADGAFEPVGGGAGWGRPKVLLARELCVFERFERPAAGRSAALAAARLRARAAAPFVNPAALVRSAGNGADIWWWDRDLVGPLLQARFGTEAVAAAPETLAQPAGEGWRIVKLARGYEAQLWQGGALVASAWRREPFSEADWAAFVRVQRGSGAAPPATPPPARPVPLNPRAAFGFGGLRDFTRGERAAMAAGLGAVAILAFTAFQLGQGMRYAERAKAAEAAVAAIPRPPPPTPTEQRDLARLKGYQALAERPRPLESLGIALAVLRRNGVQPQAYEADAGAVTVVLPYAAIGRTEELTRQLMATGAFAAVRPSTQTGRAAVELRLVPRGAVTTAG